MHEFVYAEEMLVQINSTDDRKAKISKEFRTNKNRKCKKQYQQTY